MEGSEKWPSSGSMLKAKTTGLVDGWGVKERASRILQVLFT